jgi:hypothetical protein
MKQRAQRPSVKDDKPSVDDEKQVHPNAKVEIRETLASKLEEKEEGKAARKVKQKKHQLRQH